MTAFRTNLGRAINMDTWGMANIFQVITQGDVDLSTSTQVDFGFGAASIELHGTAFGGFNAAGVPTTGLITSITFTDPTRSVTIDCAMSAALFVSYLNANSPTGLRNTLFNGADTVLGSDLVDLLNGYGGDDVIQGGDGGDTLNGGAGNDVIYGAYDPATAFTSTSDDDIINGGDGDDKIFGGLGDDVIHGGHGADLILAQGGADEAFGDEGDDFLYNTGAGPSDVLNGGSGTDSLGVLVGSLLISGQGTGYYASDFRAAALVSLERLVFGDAGGVTGNTVAPKVALFDASQFGAGQLSSSAQIVGVNGHSDIVWIYAEGGALDLSGFTFASWNGQGDPSALLQFNSFSLTLEAAADLVVVQGVDTADAVTGSAMNDRFLGLGGNDTLAGGGGNDVLSGGVGADALDGGAGSDWASYSGDGAVIASLAAPLLNTGSAGGDTYVSIENLLGSQFNDVLSGDGHANALSGMSGNDTLNGGSDADVLRGGEGADIMNGGTGDDTYYVDQIDDVTTEGLSAGDDTVIASRSWAVASNIERVILTGTGDFNVAGNGLANNLKGNSGDNWLNGSFGKDVLTGGGGRDSFIFNRAVGPNNIDTITDYDVVRDVIRIDNAVFVGIGPAGALAAGAFNTGIAATQVDDRIIYDQTTGKLFFDIDGVGGIAQQHFATLATKPTGMNASEFIII